MKKLVPYLLTLALQFNFANGQEIQIGNKVPDFESSIVNYSRDKVHLSDFSKQGKCTIIDFWATWCTSCIQHFSELDSLQNMYRDQLQILLVDTKDTRDDEQKVTTFFEKRRKRNGDKYQLSSIIMDTVFSELFPHKMIPHFVWVDKNCIVRAITSAEQLSTINIESFLEGKSLPLAVKRDLDYTDSEPLFVNGNGGENQNFLYRSLLLGYLDGLPGSSGIYYNEEKKVIRILDLNTSILELYKRAYPGIAKYPSNRIILNVADVEKFDERKGNWDSWKYNNAYSYELTIPPSTKETALNIMAEDLKRYFGLQIFTEKRAVQCFVLYVTNKQLLFSPNIADVESNIWDDDNRPKYMHNRPISQLVEYLNAKQLTPILDSTGNINRITVDDLPSDLTNISLLKKALSKYGLDFKEEKRPLEFLILQEKGWK